MKFSKNGYKIFKEKLIQMENSSHSIKSSTTKYFITIRYWNHTQLLKKSKWSIFSKSTFKNLESLLRNFSQFQSIRFHTPQTNGKASFSKTHFQATNSNLTSKSFFHLTNWIQTSPFRNFTFKEIINFMDCST